MTSARERLSDGDYHSVEEDEVKVVPREKVKAAREKAREAERERAKKAERDNARKTFLEDEATRYISNVLGSWPYTAEQTQSSYERSQAYDAYKAKEVRLLRKWRNKLSPEDRRLYNESLGECWYGYPALPERFKKSGYIGLSLEGINIEFSFRKSPETEKVFLKILKSEREAAEENNSSYYRLIYGSHSATQDGSIGNIDAKETRKQKRIVGIAHYEMVEDNQKEIYKNTIDNLPTFIKKYKGVDRKFVILNWQPMKKTGGEIWLGNRIDFVAPEQILSALSPPLLKPSEFMRTKLNKIQGRIDSLEEEIEQSGKSCWASFFSACLGEVQLKRTKIRFLEGLRKKYFTIDQTQKEDIAVSAINEFIREYQNEYPGQWKSVIAGSSSRTLALIKELGYKDEQQTQLHRAAASLWEYFQKEEPLPVATLATVQALPIQRTPSCSNLATSP